jgi:Cu(I)/Ag(I) efflux system membrane fusion protein
MNRSAFWFAVAGALCLGGLAGAWWGAKHPFEAPVHEAAASDPGAVRYTCPMHPQVVTDHPGTCPICGMQLVARDPDRPAGTDGDRVLYWYDPMRPDVHFDRPGKSPFMDMALVPKYAQFPSGGIVVDARMRQSLGVRTAEAVMGRIAATVRAVGTLSVDERQMVALEARSAGWIEALSVRATGDVVRAGQAMARLYAPEIDAALAELTLAERRGDQALAQAARTRLGVFGVDSRMLETLRDARAGRPALPLAAPRAGVVLELNARAGQQVSPGTVIARIAGLDPLWLNLDVPQAEAGAVSAGDRVRARFSTFPGQDFEGTVDYVYPLADAATRTVRARVALANPQQRLRPGMTAEVEIEPVAPDTALLVPSPAVIRTGTRTVVLLADQEGHYRPAAVTIGRDDGAFTVIESGLAAGDRVVVSGQFLIDSEASLQSALGRYAPPHPELQPVQPGGTLRYRSHPESARQTPP